MGCHVPRLARDLCKVSGRIRFPCAPLKNNYAEIIGRTKDQILKEISGRIGNRHQRKLKTYSNGFNEKFSFFLNGYRKKLFDFCGENINIEFDINSPNAKESFRMYDDGYFKKSSVIKTSQPNLLKCVILGKKGWGLWLNQWTDGIADWTFTKEEILNEYIKINLDIPESFMNDFNNRLEKKKILRNQKYLENLLHH